MTMIARRSVLAGALLGSAAMFATGLVLSDSVAAGLQPGASAPDFTAIDSNGRTVSLAGLKGKTVVLEWTNHECPFVRKHYSSDNMQALQKKWTGQGVVWLSVISSAPGEQGSVTPAQANQLTAERGAAPTAVLMDPKGQIGRAYGAQVTPHMYIIRPDGQLAYMGGIDDKPSARTADIATAKNFVDAALTELAAGKAVSATSARPYGCTVKYADPTG
ncbi:thioredoxin family protein [Ferrovibrio sp.]|uniref:thioredoxin family protein n=1 Tax=Ferrovibrio sp. TaxID=1917215 RepID=UPI0035144E33